jgi:hypothetical protein
VTAPALDVAYVPVELDWAAVVPGDVILGSDGRLFIVTGAGKDGDQWRLDVVHNYCGIETYRSPVNATVRVLVPIPERDALTLARDQLAAHVIERRSA